MVGLAIEESGTHNHVEGTKKGLDYDVKSFILDTAAKIHNTAGAGPTKIARSIEAYNRKRKEEAETGGFEFVELKVPKNSQISNLIYYERNKEFRVNKPV